MIKFNKETLNIRVKKGNIMSSKMRNSKVFQSRNPKADQREARFLSRTTKERKGNSKTMLKRSI